MMPAAEHILAILPPYIQLSNIFTMVRIGFSLLTVEDKLRKGHALWNDFLLLTERKYISKPYATLLNPVLDKFITLKMDCFEEFKGFLEVAFAIHHCYILWPHCPCVCSWSLGQLFFQKLNSLQKISFWPKKIHTKRYCPARWIRSKLGSFDRSLLKEASRPVCRKIRLSPIEWKPFKAW